MRGGIIGADPPGKAGEPASRRPEVGPNSAKGDAVKMNEIVSLKDIVVDFDGERILSVRYYPLFSRCRLHQN